MKKINNLFERLSKSITQFSGSSYAFAIASSLVLIWLITGPVFDFSETWQLVINTGTTIITFLMVFLIQKSQNKDSVAIHLKLNELIASHKGSSNRLVSIEDLSEEELNRLHAFYAKISKLAKEEDDIEGTHSLEQAVQNHLNKMDD